MRSTRHTNDFVLGQRMRLGLDRRHSEWSRRSRRRQIGTQSACEVGQLLSVLVVLAGAGDSFQHSGDLAEQFEPGRSV